MIDAGVGEESRDLEEFLFRLNSDDDDMGVVG